MSYPTTTTTTTATDALHSSQPDKVAESLTPNIDDSKSPDYQLAQSLGMVLSGPFDFRELHRVEDRSAVDQDMEEYGLHSPTLKGARAYFRNPDTGKPAAIGADLDDKATPWQIMQDHEEAMVHYNIACRFVRVYPKGTPGLLFLAPGETGDVVKQVTDPDHPF